MTRAARAGGPPADGHEPHVGENEWTRLWEHTPGDADRRRITAAVRAGEVLDDPTEALLAAELARHMHAPRRASVALVWANLALWVTVATALGVGWPWVRWAEWALVVLVEAHTVGVVMSRR